MYVVTTMAPLTSWCLWIVLVGTKTGCGQPYRLLEGSKKITIPALVCVTMSHDGVDGRRHKESRRLPIPGAVHLE
ncbi:hypothetical protein Ddc_03284 [Ditylenchus destructor]|nr:hypothetical protein Ddc_03284 [Ditylenchus destructor]